VSLLAALLGLAVTLFRPWARTLNRYFSFLVYWMENLFILSMFLAYELLVAPAAFVKIEFNLVTSNQGLFTMIFYSTVWLFFGPFLTLSIVLKDFGHLAYILSMHEGCRQAMGLVDEMESIEIDPRLKLKVYNEVRQTAIELYIELRRQIIGSYKCEAEELVI